MASAVLARVYLPLEIVVREISSSVSLQRVLSLTTKKRRILKRRGEGISFAHSHVLDLPTSFNDTTVQTVAFKLH